jgi:hypothetical protein
MSASSISCSAVGSSGSDEFDQLKRREFITLLSWARSASRMRHPFFEFVDLHQYKAPLDL